MDDLDIKRLALAFIAVVTVFVAWFAVLPWVVGRCHETVRVLALIREVRADECDQAARDASPYLAHEAGGHTSTYSVRKWLLDRAEKHREAT